MKTDVVDVSETQKHLVIEIPSAEVEQAIERIARHYGRTARVPGFRPGKAPLRVIRQRYKDQILQDVAHQLIPAAVDEALEERGLDPIETPQLRNVTVEEGRPLSFTAEFETLPPIDPGEYATLRVRKPAVAIEAAAVDQALERLRRRAARYDSIDDRPAQRDDTVVVDLDRRAAGSDAAPEHATDVLIDIGSAANPPGFDEALVGLSIGETRTFTTVYPADYRIQELAGTEVEYRVTAKALRRRVLPALDDEFAKDLGDFGSLTDLRARVTDDLQQEAEHAAERETRSDLLRQVARRLTSELPASLVEREMDRRVDDLARRMAEQQIDPERAGIDWREMRERQRGAADEAVRGTLVLDEVARREHIGVSDAELDEEIGRLAAQFGQAPAAVRARMEKEGGLTRLAVGLRRQKAMGFLLSRATIEVS